MSKWVEERGYGFIEYSRNDDDREKESIFVHARELTEGRRILAIGEKVSFGITEDEKNRGKDMAIDVRGEYSRDPTPARRS